MQTMNISLPDTMKQFVEEQVAAGAYSSASEYIRDLLRAEQKRQAKERLEQTLLDSLNSGDAIEATPEWWAALRGEMKERSNSQRKTKETLETVEKAS